MPAMASRSGSRRRSMNEINMVPFIDVMLVLLIIFMVTAPMLTPGAINVPSVGKSQSQPKAFATVIVAQDGLLRFKTKESERSMSVREVGAVAREWQKRQAGESAILIAADKAVSYDNVVKVLSVLKDAKVERVGLSVKQGNS